MQEGCQWCHKVTSLSSASALWVGKPSCMCSRVMPTCPHICQHPHPASLTLPHTSHSVYFVSHFHCLWHLYRDVKLQQIWWSSYHQGYQDHWSQLGGDWELPNPFPFLQASVSTKGHGSPCCLRLLSLYAGCTILMVTQARKLVKPEARLPKSSCLWWNSN